MKKEPTVRFYKNAPGDFYTTGECLACDAPESEAPDLLAPLENDNYDTYFVKQPKTAEEIERACRALEVCYVAALRYSGNDKNIITRLGNSSVYCDNVLPNQPVYHPIWIAEQHNNRSIWNSIKRLFLKRD